MNNSPSFIEKIIDWSVKNQFLVIMGAAILAVAGIMSVSKIPLDAIPDLTDTQVIVRTEWAGQSPQTIEDQVTFPLSSRMLGLPNIKAVRAFSMFEDSFIYVVFKEGTDIYWARSRVLESLSQVTSQLPQGAKPQLGPDATGVGWVFQYALLDKSGKHDLQELRSLQDWFVRFELATIDGVAEVASVGGFIKEYQVKVDPNKLKFYNIPVTDVIQAVRYANQETGGRTLEMGETQYLIRSFGYIKNVEDLKQISLRSIKGIPVTIGDVAQVVEGASIRNGITELDGQGEVVGGIVVMRPGANALDVIHGVKERINAVKKGLPEGVELRVVYDRSQLIEGSVDYLKDKLIEESIVVALVSFIFLLHVRSALVSIITLPLGILAAFIVMSAQGITANIMSLGGIAIAIGAMVDASIVMVENAHRKMETHPEKDRAKVIIDAAKEVGPSLFFSLLIITVSFLPVFALTGESAKLFTPLAMTKTYAMAAASILSVTIVPVLMLWFVRGKIRSENDNILTRFFIRIYKPVLDLALRSRKAVIIITGIVLLSTLLPAIRTGTEFMPPLYEGSLLYMPMTVPGITPSKAREILQVTSRMLMTVPEVKQAFGKAGRSDSATDPAPLQMLETWVDLKPRNEWRTGMTPEKLVTEMERTVNLPGMRNVWGYPIKIRTDMLSTGVRAPIGVKISGADLAVINKIAFDVEKAVKKTEGTRSAIADRIQGGKYIEIIPDRRKLAQYGVSIGTMQEVIQTTLGGMVLEETVEGRERYPITLRYDKPYRETVDDLGLVYVSAMMDGRQIPLSELARIDVTNGPSMISSENARLTGLVFVDFDVSDIGTYIKNLQQTLSQVNLPSGYTLKLVGQFEQMVEAKERLMIAVPATLLIILTLLYLHFGQWSRTLLIMLAVPFGLSGGLWSVWLAGYNLSVAVAVGFIALAGIAVETAIVMLIYIDHQMQDHPPKNEDDFIANIKHGAVLRVRPKLMTVSVIIFGLIPIFLTGGPGSDVMRRIALPMLGGMVSTTLLTLLIIPVIYAVMLRKKWD